MKTLFRSVLFTLGLLLVPSIASAATSLTKDDITWRFDGDYSVGQFVSGDWYVVAASGLDIVSIEASGGEVLSGSMLNPDPGGEQGYSPGQVNTYNANLDVGDDLPLAMSPGDMLVTTTENEFETASMTYVNQAAILTVLSSAPAANSFRPGLCDLARNIYNYDDVDYSKLARLAPSENTPNISDFYELYSRPWIDHLQGWTGRQIHPAHNMRDYGGKIVADVSIGSLLVNTDFSNQAKDPIIIGLIQMGIDFFSNIERINNFYQHQPGHINGRKFPVLFAAEMLDIDRIKAIYPKIGSYIHTGEYDSFPSDAYVFAEDSSTRYVSQDDVDITSLASWDPPYSPSSPYTSEMIGMPEWFKYYGGYAGRSSSHWQGDPYRRCCSMAGNLGLTIAVYAMNFQNIWNHQAYFDYLDRYNAIASGLLDPFGYTVPGEIPGNRSIYESQWGTEMWDMHRASFSSEVIANCSDGRQNQDETGVDCGGVCPACSSVDQSCLESSGAFQNQSIEEQSSRFYINFKITPNAANVDAVTALSDVAGSSWSDYAVIVRFNTSGYVDARDAGVYSSDLSYPYSSGQEYEVEIDVYLDSKTYDVYITHNSSRTQIADDYRFRTEKNYITRVNQLGYISTVSTHEICDIEISPDLGIRADVNGDSSISSSDALLVLRRALNRSMSGTSWISSATSGDVNCDDSVTTVDALLILREHLGLDNSGSGWCGG